MNVDVMINGRRRDHGFERAHLEVIQPPDPVPGEDAPSHRLNDLCTSVDESVRDRQDRRPRAFQLFSLIFVCSLVERLLQQCCL